MFVKFIYFLKFFIPEVKNQQDAKNFPVKRELNLKFFLFQMFFSFVIWFASG